MQQACEASVVTFASPSAVKCVGDHGALRFCACVPQGVGVPDDRGQGWRAAAGGCVYWLYVCTCSRGGGVGTHFLSRGAWHGWVFGQHRGGVGMCTRCCRMMPFYNLGFCKTSLGSMINTVRCHVLQLRSSSCQIGSRSSPCALPVKIPPRLATNRLILRTLATSISAASTSAQPDDDVRCTVTDHHTTTTPCPKAPPPWLCTLFYRSCPPHWPGPRGAKRRDHRRRGCRGRQRRQNGACECWRPAHRHQRGDLHN